jgi:hypothetical protein
VVNSPRLDITVDPELDRDFLSGRECVEALPANERSQFRWNSNPYTMDAAGNGESEFDAGAFLLPYWMSRFYGFF